MGIVGGLKSGAKQLKCIARVGVQEAVYVAGWESENKKESSAHGTPFKHEWNVKNVVCKMSRGRFDVRVNNERTKQGRYRGTVDVASRSRNRRAQNNAHQP